MRLTAHAAGCFLSLFLLCSSSEAQHHKQPPAPVHPAAAPTGTATVWSISGYDLEQRLAILASDSLLGRRTGTIGAERAARYIAGEFSRLGLSPIDSSHTFLQHFDFSEHALDTTIHQLTHGMNVVGYLRGNDPKLADEVVIIGAHYDHLGWGGKNALDTVHAIHYGADDNASGAAGLLEIAEHLSKERYRLGRSVLFLAFSGEEEGLFGSTYFTEHPLVNLKDVQAMLNMDMIGRLRDSSLIVQGTGTSPSWSPLLSKLDQAKMFRLKQVASGQGPTDHAKFYSKNIPVLFFFTGYHPDYHKATDTREKINLQGESDVVKLVEAIALSIGSQPERLVFSKVASDTEHHSTSFNAYVGGIPDYGYDGDGVKISEVTEGSPAFKAHLMKDDVIVTFDGATIKTIYDYTDQLAKHRPEEQVTLGIRRGSTLLNLAVTLGHRPSSH